MVSWEELGDTLFEIVLPLATALERGPVSLGKRLGYDLIPVQSELSLLVSSLNSFVDASQNLISAIDVLLDENSKPEDAYINLAIATKNLISASRDIESFVSSAPSNLREHLEIIMDGQSAEVFSIEFVKRLIGWLCVSYFEKTQPTVVAVCEFLGLIRREKTEGDSQRFRVPCIENIIEFEALASLISNPLQSLRKRYTEGAVVAFHRVMEQIEKVFLVKMFFVSGEETSSISLSDFTQLKPELISASTLPAHSLVVQLLNGIENGAELEGRLVSVPGVGDANQYGLGAELVASNVRTQFQWEPLDNLRVRLQANSEAKIISRALFTTFTEPVFKITFLDATEGYLRASICWENDGPSLIIDGIGGLGIRRLALELAVNIEFNGEFLVGSELTVKEAEIIIGGKSADGFLQYIFPGDGLQAKFDLKLGIDSERGVYASGSGSLELTIPLHLNQGPITLDSVYLALIVTPPDLELLAGITINSELGPISASVERTGGRLFIPISTGDLEITFLPPTGAGLSIDAGITGGGFLEFDTENERYAGILALSFGEIAITAIGLIATKLPGGKKGFSLLINIGVIFNPPIELFSAFTLSGIGGLIGVNRSMDIEVLQRGIKNHTLDSILFPNPKTVVANAAKIISDMRAVFPPAENRFVIGPMIKLGWGYPNIITADIGFFIELPDPFRIVLMGQVEAALPEGKDALISIHLDVLGVLDFAKEELSFQASLYDSWVLVFTVYGDCAFLLGWGHDPRFGLSLGGFHPKFTPPPPPIIFADLKRLTICISSGSDFQLSCQAYLALTQNSFQFGARVDLYAAFAGAVITGYMGFEALFIFSPFSFDVWIGAGVSVKYQGASLADIELSFALSGPTPWNARGKARFHILFFDVNIKFNITWGSSHCKALIAAENPWLKLQPALQASRNWGSGLPRGRKLVEALRGAEGENTELDIIRVHPAGRLEIKQNVVPLNTRLGMIGNAPVKEFNRFEITDIWINNNSLGVDTVQEYFSRGQFEELNNQQKLSVPSYEKMPGGVVTSAPASVSRAGSTENTALNYESIIIYADRTSERQPDAGELAWEEANSFVAVSNRQRALKRSGPRGRFMSVQPDPKVGANEELYCVVNAADLSRAKLADVVAQPNENMTRMSADHALQDHLQQTPGDAGKLLVVPEYEVAA